MTHEDEAAKLRVAWRQRRETKAADDLAAEQLASVIRWLVEERGWRQAAVAKEVGVSRQAISDLLRRFSDGDR